nr:retrovirus-related Pol polyprotein from transposon TNT 1-94 [Tanacetum cinerariifolium]
MRPFGCPVTILNTLDHLGKFQGKVDEGFYIGYSVCSKAFRVFNSRTHIVQETLHVNFMENKPNVIGSGPAWMFDIDSLTRTMNYHLVITENQTNSHAGLQGTEKAGEEVTHTYVLFPVLSDGSTNSQNKNKDALVDGKENDDDIQKSVSPDIHSSRSGAQKRKQGDKTENKEKGKSPIVTITGFRDLNLEFEECTNNSNMPNLEDLTHSDDADDTMNYHPVLAENQTNSNSGFQDLEKAGEEGTQTYVLFPVLSDDSINPKNNKDAHTGGNEHNDFQKSVSPDIHSSSCGDQAREQGNKAVNKEKGKNPVVTIIGFKDLNEEFTECINNSSNGVSAAGPSNAAMPNLEDLSHNADDVGAEADTNNIESIISVSPIPTTRIHKDHPTSQIIGDLSLTTQTRSMARRVRDQGGISQMFNEDFHTCM